MMCFITDNIVSIVVASVAVLLYVKVKKKLNYFAERGMPYVAQSVSGMVKILSLDFINNNPVEIYERESHRDSPYVGFFQFLKPCILVLRPTLVETILIKDFSHFQDHGFDVDAEIDPLAGHLFNMKGDQWRTLRHKLVPTFTSGKLKGMTPLMEECADHLVKEIKRDSSLRQDTNLKDLFKKYSLSVIARCAFGIDPQGLKDPNSQFLRILNMILDPSIFIKVKIGLFIAFPFLNTVFKFKMFPRFVDDFYLSFLRESFEARKKSGVKTNDFIQLLLELKEKGHVQVDAKDLEKEEKDNIESMKSDLPATKLELTEELLMAQVFVFLLGGYENVAYTIAMSMYTLSKHPEIQNRVREEVKQVKSRHKCLDYLALRDMKLLEACVNETLRLYIPLPVLIRECTKAYTLSDGMNIDKGTLIVLPAKGLHNDSRYWHNPKQFDPDRFLGKDNIRPGTFMPFGDGPRICIAQRMALLVTKLMLAKLLENFELGPSPKTKEPILLRIRGTSDVEGGLWGSFHCLT